MLSYVDDCVYWYTYEEPGKWFVDTLGNRYQMNFLGYPHSFISIRISELKDQYISVDQMKKYGTGQNTIVQTVHKRLLWELT